MVGSSQLIYRRRRFGSSNKAPFIAACFDRGDLPETLPASARSSSPPIIAAMDYSAAINALRVELEKINHAIAQLESLVSQGTAQLPKRRGRKAMGEAERKQVSERMTRYWAKRRKQK